MADLNGDGIADGFTDFTTDALIGLEYANYLRPSPVPST